ncbi:MAG: SAM-dependent methyltransferase [Clostridiales bacterium]|nr:SAM-dependent methyltransferase [Clostridiales bacterium]
MEAVCKPIGTAVQENGRYFIQLDERYSEALLGLDDFSHIQVIWWFHLSDNKEAREYYVIDAPYRNGPEKIGVFATRSQNRPNPIAVTACALLAVDKQNNRIEVNYLDAEAGTPVLDIKPYHPSSDRIRDVVMPAWCAQLPGCYEDSGTFDWSTVFN